MIILDFETFSRADLPTVGSYRYATDPSTRVCLMAFKIDGEPVRTWTPGERLPDDLLTAVDRGDDVLAHNAGFDRNIWEHVAQPLYRFPPVRGRWLDSRILCSLAAIPRSLEQAAEALGLPQQKQPDGKALIRLFSVPNARGLFSVPNARGLFDDRVRPEDAPVEWERFVEYCRQDVRTTAALVERLSFLLPQLDLDHPAWEADYRMACRGILADTALASAVAQAAEPIMAGIEQEIGRLTGGIGPSQVAELTAWLHARGVHFESLGETEIVETLATDLEPDVRRVLELRQEGSKTGWRKVYAIREAAAADGRLHDQLIYASTHTYRWTGKGVQLQNLPRPRIKRDAIEDAIRVLTADPSAFGLLFARPLEALSSLMRSMLQAPDGQRLGVCDYSKIEVVILAWLARDLDTVAALERGDDLYKHLASKIYSVPESAVTKEQRHTGKAGVLGGGYGAGWKAFQSSCRTQGLKIDDTLARATIDAYRAKHVPVVRFWAGLEGAATRAVLTGKPQPVGPHLTFFAEDRWLFCRLPSGRNLAWFSPEVKRSDRHGEPKPELRFLSVGKNGKPVASHTFGGRLCENVTSSAARDLLAESLVAAERDDLQPVLTVHDELICEGPPGIGAAVGEIMLRRPVWATDVPIAVEHQESTRYGK